MSLLQSIPGYGRTQRVVFLVDLNSAISRRHILAAINTVLSFPPFSCSPNATLFAYKFFFSSLSPLLSSSKLPHSSNSLSFDLPVPTSHSLAQFTSIESSRQSAPLATHVAASMRQILYDYSWDPPDASSSDCVAPNLVLLFSSTPNSISTLSDFLGLDSLDVSPIDQKSIEKSFRIAFQSVRDAYSRQDIHFSWVDTGNEDAASQSSCRMFRDLLRCLDWGYCKMSAIIYGSVLVPFGLIYPTIGVTPMFLAHSDAAVPVPLNLDIADVNGEPMECKYAEVEILQFHRSSITSIDWKSAKICVKAVGISQLMADSMELISGFLVRETNPDVEEEIMGMDDELIEEKVLKLLGVNLHHSCVKNRIPYWQLLLVFLYKLNRYALVTISHENGKSVTGLLKPYTITEALLYLEDDKNCIGKDIGAWNSSNLIHCHDVLGTQLSEARKSKGRSNKNVAILKEVKWCEYCDLALEHFQVDLEDVYFSRECYKSKKMKFLKCWMKQAKRITTYASKMPLNEEQIKNISDTFVASQESEYQANSCASATDDCPTGTSRIDDEIVAEYFGENAENFFDSLPLKMQQCIESEEEVDVDILAERLVKECLYWMYQSESDKMTEISKLLLKDPKEVAALYRPADNFSDTCRIRLKKFLRQNELQILLRMEILQSEVGTELDESVKQKFVKNICSFLETIQIHHEGGFFGDWSLVKYAEKIIKNRYCNKVGDVVQRIYSEMDLLVFSEDGEPIESEETVNSSNGVDELREIRSHETSVSAPDLRHEEHAKKVHLAEERRRRARRFACFTTWAPDLRKIWAPKQLKTVKTGSARCKRRRNWECRTTHSPEDVVFETPVAESKRARRRLIDDED